MTNSMQRALYETLADRCTRSLRYGAPDEAWLGLVKMNICKRGERRGQDVYVALAVDDVGDLLLAYEVTSNELDRAALTEFVEDCLDVPGVETVNAAEQNSMVTLFGELTIGDCELRCYSAASATDPVRKFVEQRLLPGMDDGASVMAAIFSITGVTPPPISLEGYARRFAA